MTTESALKAQALEYLKAGANQEQTAKALGVEPSTISYYIQSDPEFASQVHGAELLRRQKHNKTDELADEIEFALLEQLKIAAQAVYDPMKIAKIYQVINAGKRRGSSAPAGVTQNNQQVVQINLPPAILKNLQMNSRSQVVRSGDVDLVTMQSGALKSKADQMKAEQIAKQIENVQNKVGQLLDAKTAAHSTAQISEAQNVRIVQGSQDPPDGIPAATVNGISPAGQAVRRINSEPLKAKDCSASSLGFD